MTPDFVFMTTDEDPSCALQWLDRNGSVVDLSAATFTVKLVSSAGATSLTSAGSFTGFATLQGTSPQQYNLLISFAAGELVLKVGMYSLVVQATISARQRTFRPRAFPVLQIVATPS